MVSLTHEEAWACEEPQPARTFAQLFSVVQNVHGMRTTAHSRLGARSTLLEKISIGQACSLTFAMRTTPSAGHRLEHDQLHRLASRWT